MADITTENNLVLNQGKSPLVGYNFMLRVEGIYDLPCKSVHAFSRELEYDFIQEGGLNDYVHMLRKPISKPFTLEVERYVGVDYVDPLPEGADLMLPIILMVSRYQQQSSFIPFVCARTYVFTGCTVMKKEYGELAAERSQLLVETTTIAYREFAVLNAPWSEAATDSLGLLSAPEQHDTGDSALERLKKEVNDQVAKAEAKQKEAAACQETLGSLSTGIPEAYAGAGRLEEQLDSQLDAVYQEIDGLEAQTAAGQEETPAAGGEDSTAAEELEEQLAGLREQARQLEKLKGTASQLLSELKTANNLATGSGNAPNRLAEAQESLTKGGSYLASAKEYQSQVNSAAEYGEAQTPASSAKSDAQASISSYSAAMKQAEFFQEKLEKFQDFQKEALAALPAAQ